MRTRPRAATTALQSQNAQIAVTAKVAPAPATREIEPDYRYVLKDLRNIGIIVGGIVIVFIVLYFLWK